MSLAIALFILVMQFMALYINEIFGKGLSIAILSKLLFFAGGHMITLALPVAILASSLMTFGGLGERYELAAMKACGISLFQSMRSLVVVGILLTASSLYLSFEVVPRANLKFFSLLYDIQRKKANLVLTPGYFYSDIDGYIIRISDKNTDRNILYDVLIYNHTENRGAVDVILADSARLDLRGSEMRMSLYHGTRHEQMPAQPDHPEAYPYGRTYFDSLHYWFKLEGFDLNRTDENQFRHQITLTHSKLRGAIDSLHRMRVNSEYRGTQQLGRYNKIDSSFTQVVFDTLPSGSAYAYIDLEPGEDLVRCLNPDHPQDIVNRALVSARAAKNYVDFMIRRNGDQAKAERGYQFEYHQRFAVPVACLLFMIIGISLGSIIRRGNLGWPSLISISLFLTFYILMTSMKKLVKEGELTAWVGAWRPVFYFLPVAVYTTYQAAIDAKLFSESYWAMISERISTVWIRLVQRLRRKPPQLPPDPSPPTPGA